MSAVSPGSPSPSSEVGNGRVSSGQHLPVAHRLARRASAAGIRGASLYWRAAERIAPLRGELSFPVRGAEMSAAADDWIGVNAYRGLYERPEAQLVPHLVRPGGTAVDVGANIGYFTMMMAMAAGPQGTVVAFEPAAECAGRLRGNVRRNGFSHVVVREVAVGAGPGRAILSTPPDGDHNSGLSSLRRSAAAATTVDVEVVALDDEPALADGRPVDLIKVDVEGHEADVVAGARRLISSGRISHLLLEVSPEFGSVRWAVDLVEQLHDGYAAFAVTERGRIRRRPHLSEIAAVDIATSDRQFNLLLAVRDSDRLATWLR